MSAESRYPRGGGSDDSDGDLVMRSEQIRLADDVLARAVRAGRKTLWPVLATVLIGTGTSIWGWLKYKDEALLYFKWIFLVLLTGWGMLAIIGIFMWRELVTKRRTHHASIVLRICLIFGGWFTGYCIAACILVAVWKCQGHFDDGKANTLGWALLIIQALLGLACLVNFVFYVELYGRKLKGIHPQATDLSQLQSVRRRVSDTSRKVGNRLSHLPRKTPSSARHSSRSSKQTSRARKGDDEDSGYNHDSDFYASSTDGKSTTGTENASLSQRYLSPSSQVYDYHVRQPAPTLQPPAGSLPPSCRGAMSTSGVPIQAGLQTAPPTTSRALSTSLQGKLPANYSPGPWVASSYKPSSTTQVIVRSGTQVQSNLFDSRTNRYVPPATSNWGPDTSPMYRSSNPTNPTRQAPANMPGWSSSSSKPPVPAFTRTSAYQNSPGAQTRSSSTPPATFTASHLAPRGSVGTGGGQTPHTNKNPDALVPMPECRR
ncbi:hypothetical protein JCM3770_006963 [Rhodotorula araucariae]